MSEDKDIEGSVLGFKSIHDEFNKRNIIIYPFNEENVKSSSYDVSLGEYYFRENKPQNSETMEIFNPYNKNDIKKVWGEVQMAKTHQDLLNDKSLNEPLDFLPLNAKIIMIRPGETILAHTNEFIGARNRITTMMKARSTYGRCFIEVCKCAGWGDVGFYNRYTMEITNNSNFYTIPLIIGTRIAQIIFFNVSGVEGEKSAHYSSSNHGNKYQRLDVLPTEFSNYDSNIIEALNNLWTPNDMLPKLYLDK